MKELECDPEVDAKHISVTAANGAITLGGHVIAYHEKHVAVRAAERVPAVKAVADDIEGRPFFDPHPTGRAARRRIDNQPRARPTA